MPRAESSTSSCCFIYLCNSKKQRSDDKLKRDPNKTCCNHLPDPRNYKDKQTHSRLITPLKILTRK